MSLILPRWIGIVTAIVVSTAHGDTLTWPGAPPCDAGLQACVAAANATDTVKVQSSSIIDVGASYLYVTKPISLVAAPGYRPSLAAGQTISVYYDAGAGVDWSIDIEGFTITDGAVIVQNQSGNATVTLRKLDVTTLTDVSTVGSGIAVRNLGSGSLTFEIADNRVRVNVPDLTQAPGIYVDNLGNGTLGGAIHDNRIIGDSPQGIDGIAIYSSQTSSARVYANQVIGTISYGLLVSPTNANIDFNAIIANNAIRCVGRQGFGLFAPGAFFGTSEAQIFNNTIVGCHSALIVSSGTTIAGRIANNLIVDNDQSMSIPAANEATLTNDHNLLFNNDSDNFTPDPSTITTDPLLLRGSDDPRLGAGSPAIDAADSAALRTLLTDTVLPEIDADGLRRFKGATSTADIGAFEYGDGALVEFAASNAVIDNPLLNAMSSAVPQLVQDSTPDTYVAAATDTGFTALNYASSRFRIVDEVDGTAPTPGSAYNVFVPATGAGAFVQASSAANVLGFATGIDNAYTNSQPQRIVLATHRRATTAFDHPIGVDYLSGHWYVVQLDGQAGDMFPIGLGFHIYAQDPSLNAFVWTAPTTSGVTSLDHPLLNGEPCGRLYVTSGYSNPAPFKVSFRADRWVIQNTVKLAIPAGATFNVVVDEHAIEFCRYDHIFHDGFD